MTTPLAVCRADGSARIGLGHLVRSAALADALTLAGWQCIFAVARESVGAAAALLKAWPVIILDDPAAEAASLRHRLPEGCGLLVVDHYGRDADFERACRGWAERILVIDDLADRPHVCDLLIDQTPGRTPVAYRDRVPAHCRVATGSDFALLRPQFRRLRPAALARRRVASPPRRLLVSLGGADADDLTSRVIDAASALPLAIDIVMGAAAPHLAAVKERAAKAGDRIRVHTDVTEIGALMVEADIAVGAAGMSAWERCCLGLPSLVLVAADNQRPGATFLAERQAALVIDEGGPPGVDLIAKGLHRLFHDAALRRDIAARAASLADGRGVLRAMLSLADPLPAQDAGTIALRLAEPEDAMLMYEWQTAPETRRYARRPAIPTLEDHLDWYEKTLRDPARLLTLICHDGEASGILRFDQLDERPSFEISIAIAPARHGTGIGAAALKLGQGMMPGARLVAEVDPANIASRRLFQSAGFRGIGPRHFEWTAAAPAADATPLPRLDRALP